MKKRWMADMPFVFGLAALVLRRQLYITGVDAKGLLLRNHPLSIALLVLTAAALAGILWAVRKMESTEENAFASALGHGIMALGILATVLPGVPVPGYLGTAWRWLGLVSPLCLLAAGAGILRKKEPFFLLHVVPCLFFMVHIVCHYQTWSGDPQMQDYLFTLLSTMALAFYSYYTAAGAAGCGNRRMMLGMGLAAVYLCLAELANSAYPALYLAGFVWVRADLYRLQPVTSGEKE